MMKFSEMLNIFENISKKQNELFDFGCARASEALRVTRAVTMVGGLPRAASLVRFDTLDQDCSKSVSSFDLGIFFPNSLIN